LSHPACRHADWKKTKEGKHMAIAVATTRQSLANTYATLGTWIGVCTGDPGTTSTPANEASGGSPAYARQQTTWTAGSGGVQNGSPVTVNVPTGTYTYVLLASAATGATMIDKALITSVVMSAQGQLVVTPSYTQT
jgi:hypothetical protein